MNRLRSTLGRAGGHSVFAVARSSLLLAGSAEAGLRPALRVLRTSALHPAYESL